MVEGSFRNAFLLSLTTLFLVRIRWTFLSSLRPVFAATRSPVALDSSTESSFVAPSVFARTCVCFVRLWAAICLASSDESHKYCNGEHPPHDSVLHLFASLTVDPWGLSQNGNGSSFASHRCCDGDGCGAVLLRGRCCWSPGVAGESDLAPPGCI